jgi:hypothetical protein
MLQLRWAFKLSLSGIRRSQEGSVTAPDSLIVELTRRGQNGNEGVTLPVAIEYVGFVDSNPGSYVEKGVQVATCSDLPKVSPFSRGFLGTCFRIYIPFNEEVVVPSIPSKTSVASSSSDNASCTCLPVYSHFCQLLTTLLNVQKAYN